MPSHLDPFDTNLRVGEWFTIEDDFDSKPGFLRDHDESYFRAHRPSSCPPPGVPMRLIARHDHYLYASAMSWNGQEWCPAIVDLRQHEVVPLPKSVPDAITGHIERERQKHMQRQQKPPAQATEKSRRTLAREQAEAQRAASAATTRHGNSETVSAPNVTEMACLPACAATRRVDQEPRARDQSTDGAWIRLSINPRAMGRDLLRLVERLRPWRRRGADAPSTTSPEK